ncbi:carboxylate-amine ligase [Ovoidimarina sediminis]|uniref:carboxylate-amine ligase n=1 Tax=Ovoidimarina sediminis TaxID=3079856 RepID=UPI00290E82F4|nr:carboxylate-amine ligase [Rhodophyticola sp. MJ-SS7]MDU8945807.1 carboxylate-amine ligase [Rhodophyticola sp. MJ-SS7]
MANRNEALPIGIEEEYLLVDPETRSLAARPPREFMEQCKATLGEQVMHEFLQAQVEIGTSVCRTISEARDQLVTLRGTIAETAAAHGMRMIAASTHPWAHWREQEPVDMERYRILGAEHRTLARRMAICGMHVHAGIEDKNLRVELMSQVSYFMPHLLALSTSSPFWEGHDTGLKAFRPIIIGDLPRSGFPEVFENWNDWLELLDDLEATSGITDPSRIWWDIRPSGKHPTLEIRVCDICTRLEDGLTIAALYQSILAYLCHLRENNERRRHYRRILLAENKWRAQRYGVDAKMADFGKRIQVPFVDLTDELVELLSPFAEDLGCLAEVQRARTIARRGTSADEQLRVYNEALGDGADDHAAQIAVVDWLIEETAKFETRG